MIVTGAMQLAYLALSEVRQSEEAMAALSNTQREYVRMGQEALAEALGLLIGQDEAMKITSRIGETVRDRRNPEPRSRKRPKGEGQFNAGNSG